MEPPIGNPTSRRASRHTAEEALLAELATVSSERCLESLLSRHRDLLHPGIVERLAELAHQKLRVNAEESLRIAEAALAVAASIGVEESQARALRSKANALWFLNRNQPAVELYEQALALYQKLGNDTEVGRTLSSAIQPLIRLGEYRRALEGAGRARQIFSRTGDTLRLARLDLNVANVHHRQDRFAEALQAYEQAYRQLAEFHDTEAIAVALHNMAVCLIGLNDFPKALATHQAARAFCQEHGMPAVVVQADYNISYLYYLRGEYSRALDGLRTAAMAAQETGDAYHSALCALDQSEIYLELNLGEAAGEMAQEAFTRFQNLGMTYEAAKSLVNLAISRRDAVGRPGSATRSIELFSQARAMFLQEKNLAWPPRIDLYQALVLYDAGRYEEARLLCSQALEFFRASGMTSKEILCQLLLARLSLRTGQGGGARAYCTAALERLETTEAPHLLYQARVLMGQIEEAAGNFDRAAECYRSARSAVELLRDILRSEELKIAFMDNKLEVYESLIRLCLDHTPGRCRAEEMFDTIEQAKSRTLRDLFLAHTRAQRPTGEAGVTPPVTPQETPEAREMRNLREELNWYYHRTDLEQVAQEAASEGHVTPHVTSRMNRLQDEIRSREKKLIRLLRERPASATDPVGSAPPLDVEAIRAALDPGAVLVEYFRAGGRLLAAVLSAEALEVVPLDSVAQVAPLVRLLQFQFSKFRLGPQYIAACGELSFQATQAHLGELYEALVAPIRHLLRGRRLVFVPHEILHHVPLHALYDGERYLIDSFAVSYAPSASIYALCHLRPSHSDGRSLILGVADERAPFIREESHSVAEILPQPELFLGADATQQVLRDKGPDSRFIHISTHGRFRSDNPMFSAIRLGDAYLTLYDLYQLRLPAELVTLSGCSTGLNVVAKGDELLGLVRGLLSAGAKSLLLTLWDVQDRSTSELTKAFYVRLRQDSDKAGALQGAMQELREKHPHPYYWAPFVLIGSAS
jgi:tetratricopeptide (TPR) repeat protein